MGYQQSQMKIVFPLQDAIPVKRPKAFLAAARDKIDKPAHRQVRDIRAAAAFRNILAAIYDSGDSGRARCHR